MPDVTRRSLSATALVAVLLVWGAPAQAQIAGLEEWAEMIARAQTPHWAGQRTPWPSHEERPGPEVFQLRSSLRPVSVHALAGVSPATALRSLEALEAAYDWARVRGWGTAPGDAGAGGTSGLDLYLVAGATDESDARADAPVAGEFLDSMTAFAVVDADVDPDALEACVTSAYVQAVLIGQDPAEARAWRRATGDFVAWLVTGRFGGGAAVVKQQQEPWRGWVLHEGDGAGGALWLAMISARADGGSGSFVRDMWQLARQRTWEGSDLRGAPDLWMAFKKALELAGENLDNFIEEAAVARYFAGEPRRAAQAPFSLLRQLGVEATVPVLGRGEWAHLPRHLPVTDPAIEPYGSAYGVVDVRGAPPGSRLRLWLEGEFGVRWSFVAVRLDDSGRELARLTAPATRNPRSFLVLELAPGTAEVLLVGTNLSVRLPDADIPDEDVRAFQFVITR